MTPNLTRELSKKLAKRVSETNELFAESLASESAQTSTAPLTPVEKLAALQDHKEKYSVMTGIPDHLKFTSQAEYLDALHSQPEATHDSAGEPYVLPNRMQVSLQNAALKKWEDGTPHPDAELHEQIRRDTLMAQPPATTFEDSAHPDTAPRSHAEWIQRATELNTRANRIGLHVLRVPGSHFPVALGPGGALIEVEQLRLSRDPAGLDVQAQGSLQSVTAALSFEERDRAQKARALADMEHYNEQRRAEYAEAIAERAKREAAPAAIAELQRQIAKLTARLDAAS
jgi:hypothetical protein